MCQTHTVLFSSCSFEPSNLLSKYSRSFNGLQINTSQIGQFFYLHFQYVRIFLLNFFQFNYLLYSTGSFTFCNHVLSSHMGFLVTEVLLGFTFGYIRMIHMSMFSLMTFKNTSIAKRVLLKVDALFRSDIYPRNIK